MTTGAPIYLVSACASGEEFVAAFRRYADRNGVFIPIASPIPVGKRGRFALTLADGGVMIEGDGEIVSAARTPSVLHGRVGMTIRFADLDEPSRAVLAELEKARLVLKPAAPNVAPRAATVPATPRPVPPPVGGRVDASTALAECVAIGDVDALGAAEPKTSKPGPKFVVPSIPPVAGAQQRPKSPSTPPFGMRPKSPSSAPLAPVPQIDDPIPGKPAQPGALSATMTAVKPAPPGALSATMPAIGLDEIRKLDTPTQLTAVPAPPETPLVIAPSKPARPMDDPTVPSSLRDDPTLPAPARRGPPPTPSRPLPAVKAPTGPVATVQPAVLPPTVGPRTQQVRAATMELDEPTDLTFIPDAPAEAAAAEPTAEQKPRSTTIGVAVSPTGATVLPAVAAPRIEPPVELGDVEDTAESAAGVALKELAADTPHTGLPTVEEPTPSGNWTISPGDDKPTIIPRTATPAPRPASEPVGKGDEPSGNWTISLTGEAQNAWSPPKKVPVRNKAQVHDERSHASAAGEREVKDAPVAAAVQAPIEEPKIQIDSTLIEPLVDVTAPPPAAEPVQAALRTPPPVIVNAAAIKDADSPSAAYQSVVHGLPPRSVVTPPAGAPLSSSPAASASIAFRDSSDVIHVGDSTSIVAARRRTRLVVIVLSAALAVAAGVVVFFVLGSSDGAADNAGNTQLASDEKTVERGSAEEHAQMPPPPADAAALVEPPPVVDAAIAVVPPPADAAVAPEPVACVVDLVSVPAGAEIVRDREVLGTTPAKLELPCGEELKLTFRKARLSSTRTVTPKASGTKLKVTLAKPMFSVKVSSQPAGARISSGGKSLGVTPTTVKLPAFEASTLTLTKDGYQPETQKVTPKQNNQAIQAQLKKKRR